MKIFIGLFSYTILEKILKRTHILNKDQMLWENLHTFLWGIILILLLPNNLQNYKLFGSIVDFKVHIKPLLGMILFFTFNNINNSTNRKPIDIIFGNKFSKYYFCFINPIFEELLFRGIILMTFLDRYPQVDNGIFVIISSVLFVIFHINYYQDFRIQYIDWQRVIFLFSIGFLLGLLTFLTHSLWLSIITHILINTIPVTLDYFFIKETNI